MSIEGKIVRVAMLNRFYQELPNFFVRKETGKGLSTNDYTTDEKNAVAKITNIETDLANKVDGEVNENGGGYPTGATLYKEGNSGYSVGFGVTDDGVPYIRRDNESAYVYNLAQKNELTTWSYSGEGETGSYIKLFGPEDSSARPTLNFTKTDDGIYFSGNRDTGLAVGITGVYLADTDYVTVRSIKVNGTALTPDSNKAVDVDVPVFSGSGKGQPGMGTEECANVKIANRGDSDYIAINFTDNGLTLTGSIYDNDIAGGTNCRSSRIIPDETRVSALIANELADISGVDFIVVAANEELPATGAKGKFYLKATGSTGGNKYDEYVWVNHGTAESPDYGYEKLGTMDVDLTGYIKESDLQFATTEDILAIFNSGGN